MLLDGRFWIGLLLGAALYWAWMRYQAQSKKA